MSKTRTRLIILRGPSGSGKSTIAHKLRESSTRKIALLEFDVFRNDILGLQDGYYTPAMEMYTHDALTALRHGFDVVLDGIYADEGYTSPSKELIKQHDGESYVFYFDVSLQTTLKRHAQRKSSKPITEKDLKDWYNRPKPIGHSAEFAIPEDNTIAQTVKLIQSITRL